MGPEEGNVVTLTYHDSFCGRPVSENSTRYNVSLKGMDWDVGPFTLTDAVYQEG